MTKIALAGATISQSSASDHINYTKREITGYTPEYCNGWDDEGYCNSWGGGNPIYGDIPYTTSATINGTVTATVTNVKIQGKSPIVVGDKTTETDTYTIPSGGKYDSGAHSNVVGSVTVGNSKKLFVNGKLAVLEGGNVTTHAGTTSTINGGVSSSVDIG